MITHHSHGDRTAAPDVTVVMSPRERFSGTLQCIESLYADRSIPFDFMCVDGGSPPRIRRQLAEEAQRRGFRLIRTDHYLTPNEARNLAIPEVRTKYIAFVDNDIEFTPGWLAAMRQCAEETNADVVTPIVCIGRPLHQHVHFAGGEAHIAIEAGERVFRESHHGLDQHFSDVRPSLERRPTECSEFHCALVRREGFARWGLLDEKLTAIYEHTDFCMTVRANGGTIMLEPNAVVTYLAEPTLGVRDLPFFFCRWSEDWALSSETYFHRKWNTAFTDVVTRGFTATHRRRAWSSVRFFLQTFLGWRRSMFLYDAAADAFKRMGERRRPLARS